METVKLQHARQLCAVGGRPAAGKLAVVINGNNIIYAPGRGWGYTGGGRTLYAGWHRDTSRKAGPWITPSRQSVGNRNKAEPARTLSRVGGGARLCLTPPGGIKPARTRATGATITYTTATTAII